MSTFGSILSQGKHLIEVGPATLRGPGLAFSITKASVRALLRFEQVSYGAGAESGRITIDYSTHAEPKSAHWVRLATLDASELQAYGKNVLGFDTVRMVFDEEDLAAVAVWLDGVMERATPEETKYFIEVGWPSYGSRDEILGTNWHREPKAYDSEAEARRAVSKHPDLMNDDSEIRVVTSAGEVKHHRHIVIHEPSDALFGLAGLRKHHDLQKYGYVFKVHHLKNQQGEVTDTIISVTHPGEYKRTGDDKVASVDFSHMPDGETLIASRVEVGTFHKRRGIATQMYRLAQEATGKIIAPSSNQTGAGVRLWEGMRERRSLGMLSAFINSRRKYHLTGDLWQGKSLLQSQRRLTLERFDTSDDAAFFLYFHDGGLVGRVHERTVAAPNKWVIIKKGKYSVRVLRADLLKALGALA